MKLFYAHSFCCEQYLCAFFYLCYLISIILLSETVFGCSSCAFETSIKHPLAVLRLLHSNADEKIPVDGAASAPDDVASFEETTSKAVERIHIYGNIPHFGYYYIYVLIGTPPQRETVILDSGSTLFGFTCAQCKHCGTHVSKRFNIVASTSASWTPCTMSVCKACDSLQRCTYGTSYVEGSSINGVYFTDVIALGDSRSHSSIFQYSAIGCHLIETKLFVSQVVSGILGVGMQRYSDNGTAVDAALAHFPKEQRIYSICLSEEGGELTLGSAYNGKKPDESFQWTSIATRNTFSMFTTSLIIANTTLTAATDYFVSIIDSGTTYSYFPAKMYSSIISTLEKHRPTDSQQCGCRLACWKVTALEELLAELPPIILRVKEGFDISWYPKSYLIRKGNGCFELGIEPQDSAKNVLGMSFLKYHEVIFDRIHKRIGIADRECPVYYNEGHGNFDGTTVAWWLPSVGKHDMVLNFGDSSFFNYDFLELMSSFVAVCFAIISFVLLFCCFLSSLSKHPVIHHPLEEAPLHPGIQSPVEMDYFGSDGDSSASG